MMKKKHFLATLLAATVLSTGAVNAAYDSCDPCYDPCEMDSCFGGFEIGADFIYWKLCLDDLNYATSYTTPFPTTSTTGTLIMDQHGTNQSVCADWAPGFRVFLAKDNIFCDWDLITSYTWINHSTSSKTTKPENGLLQETLTHLNADLKPGAGGVASVNASIDVTYQTFDVLFASDYCFRQCHNFKPFFGVTGLFLDQDLSSNWVESDLTEIATGATKWSGQYSGYGLKMGTEYSLTICDGFSMYASASGAITVGDQCSTYSTGKIDSDSSEWKMSLKEEECVFVPGYNIGLGFQYDSCLCDMEYSARLGYEFVQWNNVNNQPRFYSADTNNFSAASSSTLATLGYHGINLGVSVTF